MRAVDGLSYAQIARVTGLPMGTVTSRMARGRAALRSALDLPEGASVTDLLGPG
jgi:RNA polymerase sigma-70 factor (ECF subfamily)